MVYKKDFTLYPGRPEIVDAEFFYATILSVKREGAVYYRTTNSTPGTFEYKFTPSAGEIEFLIKADGGPDADRNTSENVSVIYKV